MSGFDRVLFDKITFDSRKIMIYPYIEKINPYLKIIVPYIEKINLYVPKISPYTQKTNPFNKWLK